MPTFVVPHRSGAHRLAALALYRALLTQCKRTPIPAIHGEELYNLVKNRFREFRHVTSHRQLKHMFEAGYEATDYLDAATAGHHDAKDYILSLLSRAPRNAKIDPRESPKQFLRRHHGFGGVDIPDVDVQAEAVTEPAAGKDTPSSTGFNIKKHISVDRPDFAGELPARTRTSKDVSAKLAEASVQDEAVTEPTDEEDTLSTGLTSRRPISNVSIRKNNADYFKIDWQMGTPSQEGTNADKIDVRNSNKGKHIDIDKPDFAREMERKASKYLFEQVSQSEEEKSSPSSSQEASSSPPPPKRDIFASAIPKEKLTGTGTRHVPKLFSANGIPVLRLKKPLPPKLSSFLNSRIQQRDRRHRYKQELESLLELAELEDQWDSIIFQYTGIDGRDSGQNRASDYELAEDAEENLRASVKGGGMTKGRNRWRNYADLALTIVKQALQDEKDKNRIMAARMQAVVDREKELKELEKEIDMERESNAGDEMREGGGRGADGELGSAGEILGGMMDEITGIERDKEEQGETDEVPWRYIQR